MRLELPFPLSVNNLYDNLSSEELAKLAIFPKYRRNLRHNKGGRTYSAKYHAWRKAADDCLWLQTPLPKPILGPVAVTITVEDAGRSDLDNLAKIVIDFMVGKKFIEGDGRHIVRRVLLEWGDVKGCVVVIEPVAKVATQE